MVEVAALSFFIPPIDNAKTGDSLLKVNWLKRDVENEFDSIYQDLETMTDSHCKQQHIIGHYTTSEVEKLSALVRTHDPRNTFMDVHWCLILEEYNKWTPNRQRSLSGLQRKFRRVLKQSREPNLPPPLPPPSNEHSDGNRTLPLLAPRVRDEGLDWGNRAVNDIVTLYDVSSRALGILPDEDIERLDLIVTQSLLNDTIPIEDLIFDHSNLTGM